MTTQDLIGGGQGLVRMVAIKLHRHFGERFELDDLIAFGQVGLAQSAQAFDPSNGAQFSTFAYFRIRGSIYEGIEKMGWESRAMFRRRRFQEHASDLLQPEVQIPRSETLLGDAKAIGGLADQMIVVSFATLDAQRGEDAAVDREADPLDQIAAREIHQRLRSLVAELPEEPRVLIEKMYFEGCSMQAAAESLRISKSWASRLHSRALTRLANDLRGTGIEEDESRTSEALA
jgi:RNA polymerase sigma factor for flagellar operon FliA